MIREIQKQDEERLFELYQDFIQAMSEYDKDDCNMDEEIRTWIHRAIRKDHSTIWIEEDRGQVIGFARVQDKKREENGVIDYTKLSDLYVRPASRGKGVASSLINRAFQWAKEKKTIEVILNVYEQNRVAQKLYRKMGFRVDCPISGGRMRMKKRF